MKQCVSAAEVSRILPPWKGVAAGAMTGGVVKCRRSFYELWIAPEVIDVRETGGTRSATFGAVVAVTRGGDRVAGPLRGVGALRGNVAVVLGMSEILERM